MGGAWVFYFQLRWRRAGILLEGTLVLGLTGHDLGLPYGGAGPGPPRRAWCLHFLRFVCWHLAREARHPSRGQQPAQGSRPARLPGPLPGPQAREQRLQAGAPAASHRATRRPRPSRCLQCWGATWPTPSSWTTPPRPLASSWTTASPSSRGEAPGRPRPLCLVQHPPAHTHTCAAAPLHRPPARAWMLAGRGTAAAFRDA